MVQLEIGRIDFHQDDSGRATVILRETGGRRFLCLWMDPAEATTVAWSSGIGEPAGPARMPYPSTHDVLVALVEALDDLMFQRVVLTRRDERNVYYAQIELLHYGELVVLEARAADAVSLAARFDAPLYADGALSDAFMAA